MPRRYGQHFLRDPKIIERIVDASGVGADDAVLEIGPGEGMLTRALAARCRKVLAVEVDRHLVAELQGKLPPNVELRQGDALELSDETLVAALGERYHLVSNLPYEITTATLQRFLSRSKRPSSITLLIQKEVAERIVGKSGMSRLTIFCGYHSLPELLFTVPAGAFSPPPRVQSAVIRLTLRSEPLLEADQEKRLFELTERAFAQKRKTLANSLRPILGTTTAAMLEGNGLNPSDRPERISLEQWIHLASRV